MTTHYLIKLSATHYSALFEEHYKATKRILKPIFKVSALKKIWNHPSPLAGGYIFTLESEVPASNLEGLRAELASKLSLPVEAVEIRASAPKEKP